MRARESRPGLDSEAARSNSAATKRLDAIVPVAADLRASFGVLVVSTCSNGVQRAQTFATIAAATRKITRQQDRGLPVTATLVRLVPVPWTVVGEVPL